MHLCYVEEDNKVIVKRKTELGGTFYVASWILFVGLLSALLYQVITKRSIEYFTGVYAVVDLACMRDAMNRLGGDSNKINPLIQYLVSHWGTDVNSLGSYSYEAVGKPHYLFERLRIPVDNLFFAGGIAEAHSLAVVSANAEAPQSVASVDAAVSLAAAVGWGVAANSRLRKQQKIWTRNWKRTMQKP